jgi:ribosomal-protein-alanine N-acetyltransferase
MIVEGGAHAAVLAALHAASFPPGECWDAPAMLVLLEMPGCFAGLHLRHGQEPCGMTLMRVAADEAELLSIAVLPAARGQGVGRVLLEEAMTEAQRRGAARMFLEVAAPNARALALYGSCGFAAVGRRRRYYPDGSDGVVMSRILSACESRSA